MVTGAIFKSDMDGSNVEIVVRNSTTEVIAVDSMSGKLVWSQETQNVRGGEQHTIATSDGQSLLTSTCKPLKLCVTGDDLMFIVECVENIFLRRLNKITGLTHTYGELSQLRSDKIQDIRVFYPKSKPRQTENPCRNSGCSDICVRNPGNSSRCLCPPGFHLLPDNFTCGKTFIFTFSVTFSRFSTICRQE